MDYLRRNSFLALPSFIANTLIHFPRAEQFDLLRSSMQLQYWLSFFQKPYLYFLRFPSDPFRAEMLQDFI